MYKKKYKPGQVIKSFDLFMSFIELDSFVYIRNKIYHKGWVLSHRLRYVSNCLKSGHIKRAVKIEVGAKNG